MQYGAATTDVKLPFSRYSGLGHKAEAAHGRLPVGASRTGDQRATYSSSGVDLATYFFRIGRPNSGLSNVTRRMTS